MNGNLTPRQRKALEVLLVTGDVTQAAGAARVSRQTVHNWLKQAEFISALEEGERVALADISRALVRLGEQAIQTLETAMTAPEIHPSTKVRAADIVLARLLQLRELVQLEERITRLEEALHGNHRKAT
jgi:hypothetical protein